MRYIYTVEYHSSIKKNKIMPFAATWMDLSNMNGSRDCHTEWHESDREEISYDIPYMWNLKKNMVQMNLFTKQKQTYRLREWIYGCHGCRGEKNTGKEE